MKLRTHGCNIDNLLQTSDEKLGELIYPVGFWKVITTNRLLQIDVTKEAIREYSLLDVTNNTEQYPQCMLY